MSKDEGVNVCRRLNPPRRGSRFPRSTIFRIAQNKSAMKTAMKKLEEAIADKKDNTQELFRAAVSTVDKVAAKGAIHKKAANRKKAQLARAMQNA